MSLPKAAASEASWEIEPNGHGAVASRDKEEFVNLWRTLIRLWDCTGSP